MRRIAGIPGRAWTEDLQGDTRLRETGYLNTALIRHRRQRHRSHGTQCGSSLRAALMSQSRMAAQHR